MDAQEPFSGGYEQTLPVLSQSPTATQWSNTHEDFRSDPVAVPSSTLPPAELDRKTHV